MHVELGTPKLLGKPSDPQSVHSLEKMLSKQRESPAC